MIELLVGVIFALIVCAIFYYVMTLLPIPAPFRTVILLVMVLIVLVFLWSKFGPLLTA